VTWVKLSDRGKNMTEMNLETWKQDLTQVWAICLWCENEA